MKSKRIYSVLLLVISIFPIFAKKDTTNVDSQIFDAIKHIEIYNSVIRELEINYVDTINHNKLLKLSLGRMLYALDPYTVFYPASENEVVKQMHSGQYGGVGAMTTLVDGKPFLFELYQGMPAQINGFRSGDEILEIDGVKCQGKSISEISDMLRGKPHTEIKLKVRREGEKKPITKIFLRDLIQLPTVPYYAKVANQVGYIVILDFINRTTDDFEKALKELVEKHNITKLIIDLRDNGGGLVDQAIQIASLFLPKETEIVSLQGTHESNNIVYKTTRAPLYPDMELLFLVNDNTASSAEILSGAMQDLDRAFILGERTFGKALVQNIRELPYNNYLKITTAKHKLPSGRCIQAIDYANRQNGFDRVIPDSLTKEFHTLKGRIVRDGGGILPDSIIKDDFTYNISHYMYLKNIYFKYVNKYVTTHPTIASASEFSLTDDEYNDFCRFVIESGFTYRLESEKYLQDLKEMVKYEGYDDLTNDLFMQLTAQLQPNIESDLLRFREDIQQMLEQEIIKRYYYQTGTISHKMRSDKWLKIAIEILQKNNPKIQ